ncbi:hypothetical protein LY78DRAFT_82449 [Colletotrichum sublineola]|nr:hypothetical protein LY78DRAFT_82449 [Colletotrichum sublineola]
MMAWLPIWLQGSPWNFGRRRRRRRRRGCGVDWEHGKSEPQQQGQRFTHPLPLPKTPGPQFIVISFHPSPPLLLKPSLNVAQAPCQIAKKPSFGSRAIPLPTCQGRSQHLSRIREERIAFPSQGQTKRSRAPTTAEHDAVITFNNSLWKDARRQTLERLDQSKRKLHTAEFYRRSLERTGHVSQP